MISPYPTLLGPRPQSFRASSTLGDWEDPNSVLSAVAVSGDQVTLTMDNVAAGRALPSTGAAYVVAARDVFGRPVASLDYSGYHVHGLMRWTAATSIPADCWAGIVFINASTVAAATIGCGFWAGGDGTGTRSGLFYYAAGWNSLASTSAYQAGGRSAWWDTRTSADGTVISGMTSHVGDGANPIAGLDARGDATARAGAPFTHVAFCAGWLAGTGSNGAQIVLRPFFELCPRYYPGIL